MFQFSNREWDGMVRELLEQRADIAIGDLTITFDREQASHHAYAYQDRRVNNLTLLAIFVAGC